MRPLKILTWNTHGSYLYYLTHAPHEFYVLSKPGRPPGYGGRGGPIPWGTNVHDLPAATVRDHEFDCIIFQDDDQYEKDQYELLTAAQRALPRIYVEHDPPRRHATDTVHPIDDPGTLLVHVTHFNNLMWDSGRTPTMVIEHGVRIPAKVSYGGELARGLSVIHNLRLRGRRLGADIYARAAAAVPLDLVGMDSTSMGGIGDIPHPDMRAFAARYRFMFYPMRYTSLGLAAIEAMMIGMPLVALATAEMVTVIENGENGFIDTNADALHMYMNELVRNPALARHLGANAQRTARERFGIDRFAADWNAALRQVTGTTVASAVQRRA